MGSLQTARKVFRLPGKFLDGLDSLQTAWKVSRPSRKFPDGLETFRDGLENIQIVLHLSLDSFPGLFNQKTTLVYKYFPGLQIISR